MQFKFIATLLTISFFGSPLLSIAQSENSLSRGNDFKYACLAAGELTGNPQTENECQCRNDYLARLLTDEDWKLSTEDYFSFAPKLDRSREVQQDSYEDRVRSTLIFCHQCRRDQYQGCFTPKENTDPFAFDSNSWARVERDIYEGQFEKLKSGNALYYFMYNFLIGYSEFCNEHIRNWVDIVTTTRTYQGGALQDVQESTIRLNQSLKTSFETYQKYTERDLLGSAYRDYKRSRTSGRLPSFNPEGVVDRLLTGARERRALLDGQCLTPRVQATYENIKRFELGQPAIVPSEVAERLKNPPSEAAPTPDDPIRKIAITAATKTSYTASQERLAAGLGPKKSKLSCQENKWKSTRLLTRLSKGEGTQLFKPHGVWHGTFDGNKLELAMWNRSGIRAQGLAYFPEQACFLDLSLKVGNAGSRNDSNGYYRHETAEIELRGWGAIAKSETCASMKTGEYSETTSSYRMLTFLSFEEGSNTFKALPIFTRLGSITNQSCDIADGVFEPGKLSTELADILRNPPADRSRVKSAPTEFINEFSK